MIMTSFYTMKFLIPAILKLSYPFYSANVSPMPSNGGLSRS